MIIILIFMPHYNCSGDKNFLVCAIAGTLQSFVLTHCLHACHIACWVQPQTHVHCLSVHGIIIRCCLIQRDVLNGSGYSLQSVRAYFCIFFCYRYVRRKRSGGYRKDELLEDQLGTEGDITSEARSNPKKETSSVANMSAFDNPVYESNTLTPGEV